MQAIVLSVSKHLYVKNAAQLNSEVYVAGDPFPTTSCLLFMTFHCEFGKEIPSLSHKHQHVYVIGISLQQRYLSKNGLLLLIRAFTHIWNSSSTGTSGKACFHQTTQDFFTFLLL